MAVLRSPKPMAEVRFLHPVPSGGRFKRCESLNKWYPAPYIFYKWGFYPLLILCIIKMDLNSMSKNLKFRKLSIKRVKTEISNFIVKEKKKGVRSLSVFDIVLSLKIPANQVGEVLDDFTKAKRIKEING